MTAFKFDFFHLFILSAFELREGTCMIAKSTKLYFKGIWFTKGSHVKDNVRG